MDHKEFQKFLETACRVEADKLHTTVADWSRAKNLKSHPSHHDTTAGFYVNKVLFSNVYRYVRENGVGKAKNSSSRNRSR
jgi:hypothetical protein